MSMLKDKYRNYKCNCR